VQRDRFSDGGRRFENVVGRRAGASRREVVVVAARDASAVPDAGGSAADTAALLELARVFEGRPSRKTLVLASVDGSSLGELGASRLADQLGDPGQVESVLVISDLGASKPRGSFIVPWSSSTGRAGLGLQRTLAESIRQELDHPVGSTGAVGQLFRLAFPLGIGGQGVFLSRGFESVRISGSGELPAPGDGGRRPNRDLLGGLGRATLRTLTALDQSGRPAHGPGVYVTVVSQVVPGWVLVLLAGALLFPALVTAVDVFARARRRHLEVGAWLRWLGTWMAPFLAALAAAELLALAGATPDPPENPVAPSDNALDPAALGVLVAVVLAAVLSYLFARSLMRRGAASEPAGDPGSAGAAAALALVTAAAALLLWILNPYAALMAVPAAHLWLLATLVDPPPSGRARLLMVALGVLPGLAVALYHLIALHTDPLTGVWYLLLLVTGHAVTLVSALLGCVWLGALCATIAVARARRQPEPPPGEEAPSPLGPGFSVGLAERR
jgi:hypothetical protein